MDPTLLINEMLDGIIVDLNCLSYLFLFYGVKLHSCIDLYVSW